MALNDALGLIESTGWTPAMIALDSMEKSANITVHQAELNDFLGVIIKILGTPADVELALETGAKVAERLGGQPVTRLIARPDERAWQVISSQAEFNPLIQQDVVILPETSVPTNRVKKERGVANENAFALGFIETQGFTAAFEAIDSACKAAAVEVVGKEKLGGGYVTVVVKGDVAAVKAAIEVGRSRVDQLGTLIAAHVIARPSAAVLGLLPKAS